MWPCAHSAHTLRIDDDIDKPSANTYQYIPIILTQLLCQRAPFAARFQLYGKFRRRCRLTYQTKYQRTTYIIKCMFIKCKGRWIECVRRTAKVHTRGTQRNGLRSSFMFYANVKCVCLAFRLVLGAMWGRSPGSWLWESFVSFYIQNLFRKLTQKVRRVDFKRHSAIVNSNETKIN